MGGGVGSFPRTQREVFNGTKIHLFEFSGQIFEFWHHIFEFGRCIFEFWHYIFEFCCQNEETGSFRKVWGGMGWVPQDLREVSSLVLEKKFRTPLVGVQGVCILFFY